MQVFITGTDTNVGKTVVSSWICLHSGFDYFKPIQTGASESVDSTFVAMHSGAHVYPEAYIYQAPFSPHYAAALEHDEIQMASIELPSARQLVIEGAGGVLVPINKKMMMIDLMKQWDCPIILVVASRLGMINHALLSLQALRAKHLNVLGVIVTGEENEHSCRAIEDLGATSILAKLPLMANVTQAALRAVPLGARLEAILREERTA